MKELKELIGGSSLVMAFVGHFLEWIKAVDLNAIFLLIVSFLSVVYGMMKIYHQYLLTLDKKRKMTKNGTFTEADN